jgi:hypothetical protein
MRGVGWWRACRGKAEGFKKASFPLPHNLKRADAYIRTKDILWRRAYVMSFCPVNGRFAIQRQGMHPLSFCPVNGRFALVSAIMVFCPHIGGQLAYLKSGSDVYIISHYSRMCFATLKNTGFWISTLLTLLLLGCT